MALPQYFVPSSSSSNGNTDLHRSSSEGPDDDNGSITEDHDPSGGIFQSGKWYGNSASGSVAPASVLEQVGIVTLLAMFT